MPTLKISPEGQVTLDKEVLDYLGVKPGETVDLYLERPGRVALQIPRPTGSIESFFGCLAGKTDKVATLEEIKRATEDGWAGLVKFD